MLSAFLSTSLTQINIVPLGFWYFCEASYISHNFSFLISLIFELIDHRESKRSWVFNYVGLPKNIHWIVLLANYAGQQNRIVLTLISRLSACINKPSPVRCPAIYFQATPKKSQDHRKKVYLTWKYIRRCLSLLAFALYTKYDGCLNHFSINRANAGYLLSITSSLALGMSE